MIPVALAVTAVVARVLVRAAVAVPRPRRRPRTVWLARTPNRSWQVVRVSRPARARARVKAVDPAVVRELGRVRAVVRDLVRAVQVPGLVLALVVPGCPSAARPRLATHRHRPVQASAGRARLLAARAD